MSVIMYILGYLTLLSKNFLHKNKKLKNGCFLLFYVLLCFIPLKDGFSVFLVGCLFKITFTFSFIALYFFFKCYLESQQDIINAKILNLANYNNLTAKDAKILILIQKNYKYEAIIQEVNYSLGSLKNRLKFIYDTLNVGDKIGFLNRYQDFNIIFLQKEN